LVEAEKEGLFEGTYLYGKLLNSIKYGKSKQKDEILAAYKDDAIFKQTGKNIITDVFFNNSRYNHIVYCSTF